MIKIYGTCNSRAFRCLWALEESGLEHELVEVDWTKGETRRPEFLSLNPNGHVPVFEHDDLVLVESLAINLHIGQVTDTAISPAGMLERSKTIQWTIWAMGELEGPHDSANRREVDVEEPQRDAALKALDEHLRNYPHLVSEHFTIADLNVASVLMRPKYMPHVPNYERVNAWFKSCAARPALAKALGRS